MALPHSGQLVASARTGGGAGDGAARGAKRISGAGGRWGTGVGIGGELGSAVDARAVAAVSGLVRGRPMGGVGDAILAFSL